MMTSDLVDQQERRDMWGRKGLIDYAEQNANKLAAFQIECANSLDKSGTVLLTILLSGAGGGVGLFATLFGKDTPYWLLSGVLAASFYLFVLSALIIWKCLWSRYIYPPANEPKNIYSNITTAMEFLDVKEYELKNRQQCIDKNRIRNDAVGLWLNRVRLLSTFTPFIFIVTYIIFYFCPSVGLCVQDLALGLGYGR